jgi:hypothetical protein
MQTQNPWYPQWFTDPSFKADVVTQWNALKNNGVFTTWIASINAEAATLQQSQANNFGRWPMQGIEVWPNSEAAGNYDGEVAYLSNWVGLRIGYLDSFFNGKAQTTATLTVPVGTLRQGSPVTLSAHVAGQFTPTGDVSFLSGSVVLGSGALDGNGDASLTTTNLPPGAEKLEAVYGGDNADGLSASPPASVTVLAPLLATVTTLSSSDSNTTFTVLVLGNSGTALPTGTITFTANGQTLGAVSLAANGTAVFYPAPLPGGTTSIQAAYSGDNNFQGSSATLPISP